MRLRIAAMLLALLAWPAAAQQSEPPVIVNFPTELGGLPLEGVSWYPIPDEGYSVRYAAGDARIDVYMYDRGVANVPNGSDAPAVTAEFEQSHGEALYGYEARGEQMRIVSAGEAVSTGAPPYVFDWIGAEYAVDYGSGAARSYLLMAGWCGLFVKVRATMSEDSAAGGVFTDFTDALAPLLLTGEVVEDSSPPRPSK
jgi:hypothetical protein